MYENVCQRQVCLTIGLDSMRCELNGKEIRENSLIEDLHNAVLRWCSGGLLGGARKSTSCQDQPAADSLVASEAERDFDAMNQVELRKAAKALGVRQKGCNVAELKDACKCAARMSHKAERDFDTMNRQDLRKAAKELGVCQRRDISVVELKDVCKRAAWESRQQKSLTAWFAPHVLSESLDCQALPAAQTRIVVKPTWIRSKERFAKQQLQRGTLTFKAKLQHARANPNV